MKKIYLKAFVQRKGESNDYQVIASTNSIDRQGDSIDQSGWQLANYLKNPVMLWAHNYDELPVAKALQIDVVNDQLIATFQFASAEANPKAAQIKQLYDEGFLNAVSVGFIPLKRSGNIIIEQELLEISFVPVPANQDALALAMTKGLDVSLVKAELEKGDEEPKEVEEAPIVDPVPPVEEKSGRKHSAETMAVFKTIQKCISDAHTAMEDFMTSATAGDGESDNDGDEGKSAERSVIEKNTLVLDHEKVEQLRKAFQVSDKQHEFILGMLKALNLQAK